MYSLDPRGRLCTAFLVAVAAVLPVFSAAEDTLPEVARLRLALVNHELRVSAGLQPSPPEAVVERLEAGIPVNAVWTVRLFVDRGIWFSGLKDEREYLVTATYRPLRSDYLVERRLDGKLLEMRSVSTLAEATENLLTIKALPVFLMGPHLARKTLFVKVRCLYGSSVSMGVVPTALVTDWARSPAFQWTGDHAP